MAEAVKKRLENWQKFPLDSEVVSNLRFMLDIPDDEDFPEELWKVMAMHKAMGSRFHQEPWGSRFLAHMVIESGALHDYGSNVKFVAGEKVFVTKVQREGVYWFHGPMHRHIVNCHGDICLVKTSEIEAPEAAISNSDLNRHARAGEKFDAALKPRPDVVIADQVTSA